MAGEDEKKSDDGKLTAAQQDKFIAWINEKGKVHECPVCGQNDWLVGDSLIRAEVFTPGVVNIGGRSFPMAFIMCKNCAFTRQFMAMPIGLFTEGEGKDGGT